MLFRFAGAVLGPNGGRCPAGAGDHSTVLVRRSDSDSRSAAAITAGACSRPGCRDSRSIGPETDTEATTFPEAERIGADTEATPGSRSPTLWAQPRRRTADSVAAVNFAPCSPRCRRSGSSQASST